MINQNIFFNIEADHCKVCRGEVPIERQFMTNVHLNTTPATKNALKRT